jgi:hypothetical protein
MFDNKKLDEIFEELAKKTQDCKNIMEFTEIANTIGQQAIGIHQEILKGNAKAYPKLFVEIIRRLTLCMPKNLPYDPIPVLIENELLFGFRKKGVKLPILDKATPKGH